MSDDTRVLFLQFNANEWTSESIDHLTEMLRSVLPAGVKIVVVPDSIDYMEAEEVESLANQLLETVE